MSNQSADWFITTGPYPTRSGNMLQVLIDGQPALRRICEATEHAKHSVWATVTFMWPGFQMPDGRGTALEVFDRAAKRGVDVRLIFWRPDNETASWRRNAFWGAPEHFDLLQQLQFGIRWDRAQPGFCQHQKTWLIDAGKAEQTAFLGSLNLNPNSVVLPGHDGEGQNHDVCVELRGPAVVDLHHNFVQRWNEASERHRDDGRWGTQGDTDLEFPTQLPAQCSDEQEGASVQIQRTIHAGRYRNTQAAVNAHPFEFALGEQSNFAQYCKAIRLAKRSIYIENQCLEILEVVKALDDASQRGVEVVVVLPIMPDLSPNSAASPERMAFLEAFAALGRHENFTLAGIAGLGADGCRKPVWVHSKLMLVDDWATLGSANLHRFSMFGNAELNAAVFSAETVRAIRVALLKEHLALDTSNLGDVMALREFKQVARANQNRLLRKDAVWQGLAVALDVATYGQTQPAGW